jgi:hypothetical protein
MQKFTRTLAMAGALAFAGVLAGCGDDVSVQPDPGITLTPTSATLQVGQTAQFSATVTGLANKAVTWSSSDNAKATVDANGKVTAVAAGTASIIAATSDPSVKASAIVTVTAVSKGVTKVEIAPNAYVMKQGDFVQLTANVTRDPGVAGTVTWASSATAIATVDGTGKVTAVANGSAVITAASTVDPSVTGTAAITVRALAPAQVSIKTVTQGGTTNPVNFNNVFGQIDVVYNVDPGDQVVTKVDVLIDGAIACSNSMSVSESEQLRLAAAFPDRVQAAEQVCSINTAAFNATTGAVTYPNGAHQLSVKATIGGTQPGNVSSSSQALNFQNTSGFIALVSNTNTNAGFPPSAINPTTGRKWIAGNVTLKLAAVNYAGGGATVTSLTGSFLGKTFTKTPDSGTQIFTVDFPNSGTSATNIVGYETTALGETMPAIGGSNLSNGNQGSTTILNIGATAANLGLTPLDSTRVDNVAPLAPTVGAMKTWLNAAYKFTAANAGITGISDASVDNVTTEFWVIKGTNPTTACDLTGLAKVTDAAGLVESLTSLSYNGKAVIIDALGNKRCVPLNNAFGVDLGAPALDSVRGPSANEAFGAANAPTAGDDSIQVFFSDTLSGARLPNPLDLSIKLATASATSCPVGATTACNPVASANQVSSRGGLTTNGYYTYSVFASDSAGNSTATTTRTFLWDDQAPTQTGVAQQPATYTPLGSATFTAAVADNVDLGAASGYLTWAGVDSIAYAGNSIGTFGSDAFTTTGSASFTVSNLLRCMTLAQDTTAAGGVKVSTFNIIANDVAGNSMNIGNQTIPALAVQWNCGTVGNSKLAGTGLTVSATPATVSVSGAASTPKTTTLAARVETVASESAQPFSRVDFYVRNAAGRLQLIGSSSSASVGPQGTIRPFTYSITWTPTAAGTPVVVAIGVDAEGDAMRAAPITVTVNP